jgi:DNA polymerase III epsilon subunit family exonuclease
MNWDGSFWVVDVEGNGARPPEIVELALVEVRGLEPTGTRRHWLLKPNEPISPMATRIHGIHNEDLAGAPAFDDIAEDVFGLIDGAALVGHNVRVELDVIGRALSDWAPAVAIDTLKLAQAVRPGLASYALTALTKAFDLRVKSEGDFRKGEHSAPHDALVTAALFRSLMEETPIERRAGVLEAANVVEGQKGLFP